MHGLDFSLLATAALIAIALTFDFLNGFHDAANSIATVVSTRTLSPIAALLSAAFFNFIAFLVFGLHVADTIGRGIVEPGLIDQQVVFGTLMGAIVWDIATWRFGIPSSSSHALIGGLIGAGLAKVGPGAIIWKGIGVIAIAVVVSPMLGFIVALLLMLAVSWIFRRAKPFAVDHWFRMLQLVSSSLLSLGHGGNDAQKTMGIITVLLYAEGMLQGGFHVPLWVVLACQAAMAMGTAWGGWRIIRVMGSRITDLKPYQGFCAETAGAITLFGATWLGIPVSTSHIVTGSIIGVGSARRASAVRWSVARQIVIAWVITLPAAAAIGAFCYGIAAFLAD
jgi:PiT family inorganic phosphate transporter